MEQFETFHGYSIKSGLYCAAIFFFIGYVATRARLWIEKLSWLFSGPQLLAKKYVSTMLFKGFRAMIGVDIGHFRFLGYRSLYKHPSANMFWCRQRLISKSSVKPRKRGYP
jgi:hypothetical protein